jgi:hypothetical protein
MRTFFLLVDGQRLASTDFHSISCSMQAALTV